MKWIGVFFIVASAWSLGYRITCSMKHRSQDLQQLLKSLQILRNEIAFSGTPLPQAIALMAVVCQGELAEFFSLIAKEMERCPWKTPAEVMQLTPGHTISGWGVYMDELFRGLGKYDLDAQLGAIDRVKMETQRALEVLDQERRKKAKTYETIGICAGLSVSILLL